MRSCIVLVLVLVALLAPRGAAQTDADSTAHARVREELRALVASLDAAWDARDHAALERIYAPEFVWVHGFGYVDDRSTHIREGLELRGRTSVRGPVEVSFDPPSELHVYGDVALLRTPLRNAGGNPSLGTTVYARRDGRWQIVQMQSTELNPERTAVPVDPASLDAYVGRYDRGGGRYSEVARTGDALVVRHPTLPERILTPVGEGRFFDKAGNEHVFERGPDGQAAHLLIRVRNGGELRAARLPR